MKLTKYLTPIILFATFPFALARNGDCKRDSDCDPGWTCSLKSRVQVGPSRNH